MKIDFAAGADCNGVRIQDAFQIVLHDVQKEPQEAARLQIVAVPTIILPDGTKVGYTDAPTLAAQLRPFQFPIVSPSPIPYPDPAFPGPLPAAPTDPPPNKPEAEKPTETPPTEKPAEPEAAPDLTAVRLVGLVQKQGAVDWGPKAWLKGVVLTKLERRLESQVPAKVRDVMGDKLRVALVFQRLNPTRFDELQTAAAIEPAKVSVVALVGEKFEGVTGKLIAFIESKLAALDDLRSETIDLTLIFERSESERYHAVIDALAEEEPVLSDEAITIGGGGTAVGGITGAIAWFRRRRNPAPQPPEQAVTT